MINTLESTTSQYNQALYNALQSATAATDLVNALTTIDDSQQSDRLKWIFNNYTKSHLSSFAEASLIQDAIATL